MTLILSYATGTAVDVTWLQRLNQYGRHTGHRKCFLFLIPRYRPPFIIAGLTGLRQEEAILLRNRPLWAQGFPGLKEESFGIPNILEGWQRIISGQQGRPSQGFWSYRLTIFVFISFLAIMVGRRDKYSHCVVNTTDVDCLQVKYVG